MTDKVLVTSEQQQQQHPQMMVTVLVVMTIVVLTQHKGLRRKYHRWVVCHDTLPR